ncbi:MAG: hypothetical protein KTR14_09660 [Vampirovibrio sp.]|nr:hypothetical protein [Vampirovibrio sp.]
MLSHLYYPNRAVSGLAVAVWFVAGCVAAFAADGVKWDRLVEDGARTNGVQADALTPVELAHSPTAPEKSDPADIFAMPAITLASSRPDDHGPIGVMGDHVHKKGEWMLSYRYMHMFMKGHRDGTDELSNGDVLRQFMVVPTDMKMDMHMVGGMYAPTNWLTTMVMVPYTFTSMDHRTRTGVTFRTRSEGFGDIKASGLIPVFEKEGQKTRHKVLLKGGVSFPTGSINQRDRTPAGANQRLPYPMQLGSGTYDLMPGVTYTGQAETWSWGLQGTGVIRLGKNSNQYRLGNRVSVTPWVAKKWASWLSTSVRLNGQSWGNITGADPVLNPNMIQTANPNNQGGQAVDLTFGINLLVPKGFLKNQRVAIEMGFPLHQNLDGPQLERDLFLTVGWQWGL